MMKNWAKLKYSTKVLIDAVFHPKTDKQHQIKLHTKTCTLRLVLTHFDTIVEFVKHINGLKKRPKTLL